MTHSPQLTIVSTDASTGIKPVLSIENLNVWHEDVHILHDINLQIKPCSITCIIGPSGGGKSTLIRSLNRINDGLEGFSHQGTIHYSGNNIHAKHIDVNQLRTKIGMVFQKPTVFPKSIFENVLFGRQDLKSLSRKELLQIVEENLKAVSLWNETAHRLDDKATSLSVGQQQRLCIARTLAIKPDVILFDEPTSALDPLSTRAIEELMLTLKKQFTIVFVTHNIPQAKRIADTLVFICDGQIIEQGSAERLFAEPKNPQTRSYLQEEFCAC